jgi:hypothetical protein
MSFNIFVEKVKSIVNAADDGMIHVRQRKEIIRGAVWSLLLPSRKTKLKTVVLDGIEKYCLGRQLLLWKESSRQCFPFSFCGTSP